MNELKQKLDYLKGTKIKYQDDELLVKTWYMLNGQVNIVTASQTIRFNKSVASGCIDKLVPTNGNKTSSKNPVEIEEARAGSFYATRDYSKFTFHTKNRAVNKTHVSNLVKSIEENDLLSTQPILVNELYEVIDGQHRLCAAKEMGCTIYYIIHEGLKIEDAICLNINTKNWGYGDYLEHWISQGNEHYYYYKEYKERYGFSYTLALGLLHYGTANGDRKSKSVFENGEMEIRHKQHSEFIGRITKVLSRHGGFTNDRGFIRALDQTIQNGKLDPYLLIKKVAMVPDRFHKCSDTESYLRMMEDVINYHSRGERMRLF